MKQDEDGEDEYNQDFIPDESQEEDPAQDALNILNDPFGIGSDVKDKYLAAAKQ